MMCGHVSLSKKKTKVIILCYPFWAFQKNYFQITLNKDYPHTKGWHNVCFIRMVVHQYENIKKKKRKDMVISRKQKKKASKRWTRRSQTNSK